MPEIKEATRKVQRSAKDLAPVDTGNLRGSIRTKLFPKEQTGIVYTVTEYALHQEFGTRRMKAQPFMIPALNINRAGIISSMGKYIKSQLANPTKGSIVSANEGPAEAQPKKREKRRTRYDGYNVTSGGKVTKVAFKKSVKKK